MSRDSKVETIVALSSGALPSGIAVLRVSGPAARGVVTALAGSVPAGRRAGLRRIRDRDGATLDRGLVLFFEGPGTASGEDSAEFHLHGGRATVSAVLAAACALPGVRLAEAGEFTRRAFENGRIDLTEAEGLGDLLAAETERQRRAALDQADGSLRRLYEGWMDALTGMRAMIEASLDFADEGDVGETLDPGTARAMARLLVELEAHLDRAERGEILRAGFRVAIVGPPNAGKSSLMNALARRDVAIVTPVPGTTRDVLEVTLDLRGIPVRLFDTAGLRETDDPVEAIGIERARRTMDAADLVLSLVPADALEEAAGLSHVKHAVVDGEAAKPTHLTVLSKADLAKRPVPDSWPALSTRDGTGLESLLAHIAAAASEGIGEEPLPLHERHRALLGELRDLLREALDHPDDAPELQAERLREAADRLGLLTGRRGVEDLLDIVFSRFCIGK
ncbi:tRNA uridine-5-carboxymethylaminomethyl(34) synthesis GTPase MnmE [Aurantimonas sp. Leaf443]|uniref:tRNA uridine-5-carboxymethylaminomethyl(34) synthesis GTPase MnmE n=1 Tax=Aurantimonas sp. Leaf443 TaxID=1736378 RepID=UPI0006F224CA|nr:tRNA uridine-5-carboxymethylaminomethyl(34) synthesis GTPase MnmE [Aurantimonas sp. Leaf443]KQT85540.1 hypothetical protein ASG48_10030 [Aurantimonas sp. Leaf443]